MIGGYMKKETITIAVAIAINFSIAYSQEKVIYGDDNRIDYWAMSNEMKNLANSVVSFWERDSIKFDSNSRTYKLQTTNFGTEYNLCPEERFKEQPIGAFCSGSLVGDDIIMTAGHCVKTETDCKNIAIVFGFNIKTQNGNATTTLPEEEVYFCQKIIKRQQGPEPTADNPQGIGLGPDYALIKLDRKVIGHRILKINRNQNLKAGDPMFVIGHPVGLPVKLADDATVRDPKPNGYFVANLDTYGGNSGSPVFNARTKLIEGILVRGDNDFERTPQGCIISHRVPQNEGRGEDVTKISVLAKFIPESSATTKTLGTAINTEQLQKETYSFIENASISELKNFKFEGEVK